MSSDPTTPPLLAADRHAGSLVTDAATRLTQAGIETARLDAEVLVSHAFGRDRTWLHAHPDATLDGEQLRDLGAWLQRRVGGEPIAYIRGFKEWFGQRVLTDPRALIPRPETELLAESAIGEIAARLVRDDRQVTVHDVATGSGAVALALAIRFRAALALGRIRLVASDVSPDALELASDNLASHGVAELVSVASRDLLADDDEPVDVITANLPYLRSDEVAAAPGSIAFEPARALDGGPDGLNLVRRLVTQLPARLAPGGVALLEIGAGQGPAVQAAVEDLAMPAAVTLLPDLAGIERVVRIARLDG